ncbi:hypothetical protein FTUN_2189 [Frigoriglobus tundricola]|uniref:Uncharacterized protein n=1 Tax=Frigoriglobus tundricola TaxID=2774151 RepID=A0A6M5YKV9_9BACT|nr:hypothetical protein FTUN_2189 [Frigoriglobus tundricola]
MVRIGRSSPDDTSGCLGLTAGATFAAAERARPGTDPGGVARTLGKSVPAVSVVKNCTTLLVEGSISAVVSRTPIPVMPLSVRRRGAEASVNNCRWCSRTRSVPAGLRTRAFSAAVKEPCSAITTVSSFKNTVTHLRPCLVRRVSNARTARAIVLPMVSRDRSMVCRLDSRSARHGHTSSA